MGTHIGTHMRSHTGTHIGTHIGIHMGSHMRRAGELASLLHLHRCAGREVHEGGTEGYSQIPGGVLRCKVGELEVLRGNPEGYSSGI